MDNREPLLRQSLVRINADPDVILVVPCPVLDCNPGRLQERIVSRETHYQCLIQTGAIGYFSAELAGISSPQPLPKKSESGAD